MKLETVAGALNEISPLRYSDAYCAAYGEHDNSGLLLGDPAAQIRRVLVALDATERVAAEAKERGCDLVISHHPLIYYPVGKMVADCPQGRTLLALAQSGIAAYAMHLNLDVTLVNDTLAQLLNLTETAPLLPVLDSGIGRVGRLPRPVPFEEFSALVAEALSDRTVFYRGEPHRMVEKVAVVAGGGGGDAAFLNAAIAAGAHVLVSGDFKHYVMTEAAGRGMGVVSASHYSLEAQVLPALAEAISKKTKLEVLVTGEGYPYRSLERRGDLS